MDTPTLQVPPPTSPIAPSAPNENSSTKQRHGHWILLFLILILAVAVLIIFIYKPASSLPQDAQILLSNKAQLVNTIGWKTRKSKTYGYSVSYPANWIMYATEDYPSFYKNHKPTTGIAIDDLLVASSLPEQGEKAESKTSLQVLTYLFENNKKLSMTDWLHQWGQQFADYRQKHKNEKNPADPYLNPYIVYDSITVTKQNYHGIRRIENCTGNSPCDAHGSFPYMVKYYFPLHDKIFIFAYTIMGNDLAEGKHYASIAETMYDKLELPDATQ